MNRRHFLKTTSSVSTGLALYGAIPGLRGAEAPSRRIRVGVMGLGRGLDHVQALRQIPGVEVAWLCDIDTQRIAAAMKAVEGKLERTPQTTQDFRRMLEDGSLEAITIAAPRRRRRGFIA